jgi:Sulfotransferase family
MTVSTTSGGSAGDKAAVARSNDQSSAHGMIVILTYPHAGDQQLREVLSANQSVTCTYSTGLLPLCHSAMTTWRNVEARNAAPSQVAIKSVRSLVSTMLAVIRSGAGATRYCETAYAAPAVAESFLRVFADTTFICLHRSLLAVLSEAAAAYPWGLGGSPFWYYSGSHPGNNLATIAEYWIAHTRELLDFEAAHPLSCVRLRHEDLHTYPPGNMAELFARLGLGADRISFPYSPNDQQQAMTTSRGDGLDPHLSLNPPLERVSPALLTQVNDLQGRLGYEPLTL